MSEPARSHRERRRHTRALTDLKAAVTVGGGSYPARVINLSMGGALLDLGAESPDIPVARGGPVSLVIRCRGREQHLHAEARVVMWNTDLDGTPLLGVQFEPMGDEASEILEELMTEALTELRSRAFVASTRSRGDC